MSSSGRARVGIITDSHVGDELAVLPPEALDVFAGVDLIIHAGDICEEHVLDDLRRVAPVVAVRGNHDRPDCGLPETAVVEISGARIGVIHGVRPAIVEYCSAFWLLGTGRVRYGSHCRALSRRLPKVDWVISGHIHIPFHREIDGTTHYSPGAAYAPERDPDFDWSTRRRKLYGAIRRRLPPEALVPAVGILEIDNGHVSARTVPLNEPIRANASLAT